MNLTEIIYSAIEEAFDERQLKEAIIDLISESIDYQQAAEVVLREVDYDEIFEQFINDRILELEFPF